MGKTLIPDGLLLSKVSSSPDGQASRRASWPGLRRRSWLSPRGRRAGAQQGWMPGYGKPHSGVAGGSVPGHRDPPWGAHRALLPPLPRMLRWEAAALGWESPGSPLRTGCPHTSRDPTAGTGPGFQGKARSSCVSSSLCVSQRLAPHRLPGISAGLQTSFSYVESGCVPQLVGARRTMLIGKRNYLHLLVPFIKAKPGSVCFFSQAGARRGWVPPWLVGTWVHVGKEAGSSCFAAH